MKLFIFLTILFTYSFNAFSLEKVMITAFEPFGGSDANNSMRVANEIKEQFSKNEDIEVVICVLPVVYDIAAQRTEECLANEHPKPSKVISLGEAGCNIRYETAAHNQDDTPYFPDNAGNIRNSQTIASGGAQSIGFNLPVHKMYCSETDPEKRQQMLSVSETPGGFVCNNTAYHLANSLSDKYQYSFIHVPNTRCGNRSDPVEIANTISAGIEAIAMPTSATFNNQVEGDLMCLGGLESLPLITSTIDEVLNIVDNFENRECYNEFFSQLRSRL